MIDHNATNKICASIANPVEGCVAFDILSIAETPLDLRRLVMEYFENLDQFREADADMGDDSVVEIALRAAIGEDK